MIAAKRLLPIAIFLGSVLACHTPPHTETSKPPAVDPETTAWSQAQNSRTPESYSAYIQRYPNGAHAREARRELDKASHVAFEAALRTHTSAGFQAFIDKYPNSSDNWRAQSLLKEALGKERDKQALDAALASSDESALQAYVKSARYGEHQDVAIKRLMELRWKRLIDQPSSSLTEYVQFAAEYPRFLDERYVCRIDAEIVKSTSEDARYLITWAEVNAGLPGGAEQKVMRDGDREQVVYEVRDDAYGLRNISTATVIGPRLLLGIGCVVEFDDDKKYAISGKPLVGKFLVSTKGLVSIALLHGQ